MASPNAPKTVEQLIREHSKAGYIVVNHYSHKSSRVDSSSAFGRRLASDAREMMVRRYA